MFAKPLPEKVKDLAIVSDRKNVKILCALTVLKFKGRKECTGTELQSAASISSGDLSKYGKILSETKAVNVIERKVVGMSTHKFYSITNYGERLLRDLGIDKNVIRNEIERG